MSNKQRRDANEISLKTRRGSREKFKLLNPSLTRPSDRNRCYYFVANLPTETETGRRRPHEKMADNNGDSFAKTTPAAVRVAKEPAPETKCSGGGADPEIGQPGSAEHPEAPSFDPDFGKMMWEFRNRIRSRQHEEWDWESAGAGQRAKSLKKEFSAPHRTLLLWYKNKIG